MALWKHERAQIDHKASVKPYQSLCQTPLTNLLRKIVQYNWTETHQKPS